MDLYHHRNQQGSTTELTLSGGQIVESYRYDAFGTPTIRDRLGTVVGSAPSENPFLFTGRELDEETGFYYFRARTYDPATGAFLQEDPKGRIDDLNPVVYALSNPVAFMDPMGTDLVQAAGEMMSFIADNIGLIGSIVMDAIPGLRALLDALSALAGKDYTAWLEGGAKGSPEALGFWARLAKGATAAVSLVGAAAGSLARLGSVFKKIKDLVNKAKGGGRAKGAANRQGAGVAGRSGGCFVLGTLVLMASGELVPIEDVRPGDRVYTEVPAVVRTQERQQGAYEVRGRSLRVYDGAIHVITVRDSRGREDVIRGTPEHPFWDPQQRRWVAMADLRIGGAVDVAGGVARVVGHGADFRSIVVANLSISTANTYRLGTLAVLTHNGNCDLIGSSEIGAFNQIKKRKAKGADGATSIHIISRDGSGRALSVTHRVTKDGKVIHQHTTPVGGSGH